MDSVINHSNFVVYKSIEGYDSDSSVYAYNFSLDSEGVTLGFVLMEAGLSKVKAVAGGLAGLHYGMAQRPVELLDAIVNKEALCN